MASERGKVVRDDTRKLLAGQMPSAEFYARLFEEEKRVAREEIRSRLRRPVRRASAQNENNGG